MDESAHNRKRLRRLERVWIHHAVYFVTTCMDKRKPILTEPEAARVLRAEWARAKSQYGWLIGRYVIMPDHVHFFCAEHPSGVARDLSTFMKRWKEWTSKMLIAQVSASAPVWQKGFFDHVLRRDESYAEKWQYVRENPVRAGLAVRWEDWPYQGFVDFDHPYGDF